MSSRHAIVPGLILALAWGPAGCSCDEFPDTTHVPEQFAVEQGEPGVSTGKPGLDEQTPAALNFQLNVPRQCDFFQQNAVRKVDILWVVDNSGSMKTSQANLASEFPKFIDALLNLQPPVDFHIAVTSTDTDNPELLYDATRDVPIPSNKNGTRGALHGFDSTATGGPSGRYIACDSTGTCNAPRATFAGDAFAQMSKVGTAGSPVERGLLSSYLALTLPENLTAEAPLSSDLSKKFPFIRGDAALFVVYVSDEDDSSCAPYVPLNAAGRPISGQPCQADPGCMCDATRLTFGSTDYFIRFLESYKGFGHNDLVAAGAVVCTDTQIVPAQNGDPYFPHLGCPDEGNGTAYFGSRYIAVANGTGGTSISIRGSFANALQSLGFAVSGLRNEFRLSRGPFTDTLQVYLTQVGAKSCTVDTDCATAQNCRGGVCVTPLNVDARSLGDCTAPDAPNPPALEYCKCDETLFSNILRFNTQGQPPAQSSIEVCYDVNSNFNSACQ